MSNVEFEEFDTEVKRPNFAKEQSSIVALLLKMGIAKDDKQANMILIGVAISAFLLTIWMLI